MPLKKTEDLQFYQPGTERDDFMTSVPMSTYLVAIAVCDYVYLRSTTAKGVKISLYAPAEQVSRGGLALNTALQVLTYYEEFFGVSYPLPKLGNNFMNSWVDKQGYPLIELSMDDGELIARQRRYSNSRTPPCPGPAEAHLSNSPCSDIWNLRLTCLVGGRDGAVTRDGAWMNKTSTSFTLRKNMKYVKCNVQGKGFYRVAYSADLWRMLQASIDDSPSSFDTLDKASLFSDAFALTCAHDGHTILQKYLDFTAERFGASPSGIQRPMKLALCLLPRETDYTVWATALEELARIDTLLRFQPEQKRFRDFLCRVMKTVYETLGWVHEGSHLDKMLRAKIMETSVMIEMSAAVETGVDLFKSWKVSIEDYIKHARPGETSMKKRLPPDLRLSVYIAGVRYLGKDAFDLCLKVYKRCNNPVQRQDLLIAMTKTRNIAQLE
ncbi:unnamed protein product, partial [Notodromas monacha]